MDVVFTRCAGLDVHQKSMTACRMVPGPTGQEGEGIAELRTFGTMTRDLLVCFPKIHIHDMGALASIGSFDAKTRE